MGFEDIRDHLVERHNQTIEAASQIAYLCNGNLADALSMLADDTNSFHGQFVQWLRLCFGNKGIEIVAFVDQASKMGRENQKNFLRYGVNFIRECCLLLSGAGGLVHLPEQELETAKKMAKVMNITMAQNMINELEKAHYHIERNANPKILFLDVSLQIVKIVNLTIRQRADT